MSLLVIGELGEVLKVEQTSELKKYIDNYNKKMNLDANDIYIIDKNGKTVYPNSLSEISYDSKFFIFNRIFYKDKLIKIYEESIEKIHLTYSSMSANSYLPTTLNNLLDSYEYFFTLFEMNSATFEKNGLTLSEIKNIFDFFNECNDSVKKYYLDYKLENKICDKTRDNYNFQYNSLECIYKNISILYEQCFTRYKELENELGDMKDGNNKILQTYKNSIEKLKTIEIHPKMQTKRDKFLIDIYFEESKMNVWREKCMKSSEFITNKIKSKNDTIVSEKNRIRNEKKSNILALKEDWNSIISEYETFVNDKENSTQLMITNISEEIKKFRKILNGIRENILNQGNNSAQNNNNIEELFDELKLYKTRIPNIKNLLISFQTNVEEFAEFAERMKNLLFKSSVSINLVFTNYHTIKKNLLEIIDKLGRYSEGIKNLEKDYSYLINPSQFPDAYNASLIEIKRRIIFNKKISKDFERMKQLVGKENINRKQFIQDYGKYLTHDYVPQLKFSDLELKIEINNQDEVDNLPNILDEDEENTINNNNIYLDYDEIQVYNRDNNFLIGSNSNNKINSEGNVGNSQNNYRVGVIKSLRKNSNGDENSQNNYLNLKKGMSEDINSSSYNKNSNTEDIIRNLNLKLSEVEIMVKVKEAEIKKLYSKIELRDRKITNIQSEIDKLSNNFDAINDNYLKQVAFKEQKLRDKNIQCDNLLKIINNLNDNKLESCPFCKDIAINNLDTAGWYNFTYVKDYHEKIIEKNQIMTKLEVRYTELVAQTNFLKKTFFNHLNNSIEIKNKEISMLKENYENKLMNLEDLLSQEKNRIEKYLAVNNSYSNQENNPYNLKITNLEEQIRVKDILLSQLESKLRDSNKQIEVIKFESKKLLTERENLEKQIKDMKIRENNLNADIMLKDGRIENLNNELRNIEKIIDNGKKKIEEKEREALLKLKENTELKNRIDMQTKEIDELRKFVESIKNNHKEELNDKNKNNQFLINELNYKLDDLTKQLNDKLKIIEEHKLKNQELISIVEKKNEEIRNLKENIESISKSQQELDILRDKMEQLECFNNNENYKLKKKLEEMQSSIYEKEKKLQDFNELTKLFSTNDIYLRTNANTTTMTDISAYNKTLTMALTNLNINTNMTKFLDFEEFVNVKRLDKGTKAIFVPHSPGVYVSITLNSMNMEHHTMTNTNFNSHLEHDKYYKCNAILNLNALNNELKDLLIDNSLIIIGKIGKINEIYITNQNNEFNLPEENTYIFVDLEKIDYIIGFQGEEMIFRNYLF